MKNSALAANGRVNGDIGTPKKIRIQFELLEGRVATLEHMMAQAGIATKRDLLEQALTLFEWAVEETEMGNKVGFLTPDKAFRPLLFNPLRNVAMQYETRTKPQEISRPDKT